MLVKLAGGLEDDEDAGRVTGWVGGGLASEVCGGGYPSYVIAFNNLSHKITRSKNLRTHTNSMLLTREQF